MQDELELTQRCDSQHPIFDLSFKTNVDQKKIDAAVEAAFLHPELVAQNLTSDPYAAVAIYTFATNCYSGLQYGDVKSQSAGPQCAKWPEELSGKNPLDILLVSAKQGHEPAMFIFALNASVVGRILSRKGDPRGHELLKQAEHFGDKAARAGNMDAMRLMSQAYEHGHFGVRSPEKAYIYALPLQALGTANDQNHIRELATRLTPSQANEATLQALGCKKTMNTTLASPFGS